MASTAHVRESRALVFPVMCNGYLQLDYSESNTSNYKHNLWGHKDEGFTFEAIVSPYDVNGIGHRTSGLGRLDSTNTPPSPNLLLVDVGGSCILQVELKVWVVEQHHLVSVPIRVSVTSAQVGTLARRCCSTTHTCNSTWRIQLPPTSINQQSTDWYAS